MTHGTGEEHIDGLCRCSLCKTKRANPGLTNSFNTKKVFRQAVARDPNRMVIKRKVRASMPPRKTRRDLEKDSIAAIMKALDNKMKKEDSGG